jgi:tRNA(adenine34) deaminase
MDFQEAMRLALLQAKRGYEKGEVPVGAVLLIDGQIIASAHNQVEDLKDASAHAEMLCLKKAAAALGDWRLKGSVMVSTLEPCVMCAGAMILHRVEKIVWGAPDIRHGAHGSWIDLTQLKHPIHNIEMIRGVLQDEAAKLMRDFFKERRLEHHGRNGEIS